MVRPPVKDEDQVVETWESCIDGAIYINVYDRREDRYVKQGVGGGTNSKRLHLTRDDRKYNQEIIPIENRALDPFTNGSLRLIDSASRDETLDTRYHFSVEDIEQFFEMRDIENFEEALHSIESELVLRRIEAKAQDIGTLAQVQAVKDELQDRFPIGGTQKAVREMLEAGERVASFRM